MSASTAVESSIQEYIGRWNQLVSTTNWEKGRIIYEWRESLRAEGAPEESYTDDAWAQQVGQITPQHVGRLRRVWERFGDSHEQYPGLFWSHFQAAVNWDDAETWLQGAVDERWSVARMREQRWEAHGAPPEMKPRPEDIFMAEVDEDVDPRVEAGTGSDGAVTPTDGEVRDVDGPADSVDDGGLDPFDGAADSNPESAAGELNLAAPAQPFRDLGELPEDVDEALEAMKLAIIAHKSAEWQSISRDDMLRVVEGLRTLILAPA